MKYCSINFSAFRRIFSNCFRIMRMKNETNNYVWTENKSSNNLLETKLSKHDGNHPNEIINSRTMIVNHHKISFKFVFVEQSRRTTRAFLRLVWHFGWMALIVVKKCSNLLSASFNLRSTKFPSQVSVLFIQRHF